MREIMIDSWKRYWCLRGGEINLSQEGFLLEPDSELGKYINPEIKLLEELLLIPCLILLGEPGTGKSTIIDEQRQVFQSESNKTDSETLWLDLRSIGSEQRLIQKLFETPKFRTWVAGDHNLNIFLDSLDECLLRVDTVGALLTEEFGSYPVERLSLRIVCRTSDWPLSLEKELRDLWGDENVKIYELTPLRRCDVAAAANARGLNPDMFIQTVRQVEATPLAIKPVTLSFLLNTYQYNQGIPSSAISLYAKGCELLCSEINQSRRDLGMTGKLSAKQKMLIAARIAAVTTFSNKYAVWTGIDAGDVAEEDISLNSLIGGTETCEGVIFEVSEAFLRETLGAGLFTSRGPNRLSWSHQTYAEYLTSWYISKSGINTDQILSLLKHNGDKDEKVVPQLSEVAAWIASMNSNIFSELIKTDPEVLLRSDVFSTNIQSKIALIESLLHSFEEEQLLDRDYEISKRFNKLEHPGLADQLRPYICDRTNGVLVRRVAIDIAEDCRQLTLIEDLVKITLDQTEEYIIRIQAACAISRIGDNMAKLLLLPLAKGESGNDPDDELKGYAIRALWPDLISAKELFYSLTNPKKENYIGSYAHFLSMDFIDYLSDNDIIWALRWVQGQGERYVLNFSICRCMDAIMFKAWNLIFNPQILHIFAQTVISRLEKYDDIAEEYGGVYFHDMVKADNDKRRIFIQSMIDLLDEGNISLLLCYRYLILKEDTSWLLERLKDATDNGLQRKWAEIISWVLDTSDQTQLETIYEAMQKNTILAERLHIIFGPIALNSVEADNLRKNYSLQLKYMKSSKKTHLQPPPAERLRILLSRLESGNLAAWWQLNREMTLGQESTHYRNELESDLTTLPGWQTENADIHKRILAGAQTYLLNADPETSKWLGTNTLYFPAYAGYRALRLIRQFQPEFLEKISPDVWARWAPIILAYPTISGEKDEDVHNGLVKNAFEASPMKIINTLKVLIDQEDKENSHISITKKMIGCWGYGLLEDVLFAKLKDPSLKCSSFTCLLNDLLEHGVEEAYDYAVSLLNSDNNELAVVAAASLLCNNKERSWDVVWMAITRNNEFGEKVIYRVLELSRNEGINIIQTLDEKKLSALYIWLEKHSPRSEDPNFENESMAHFVGSRESVAEWRDNILRILEKRGTQEACSAIAEIQNKLPYLDWVKWHLLEAQSNMRRKSWVPIKPSEFFELIKSNQSHFIQNGEALTHCILESLDGLQLKLQGETPAAIDLWNYVNRKYTPKDENTFSDYIKRYLEEDLKKRGIIVNREVEIRRGQGGNAGERTDIIVDAVIIDKNAVPVDVISVVIETKGCWHPELLTAMKSQLADRYLRENQCKYGIYLVGWFNCVQWDGNDYRLKEAEKVNHGDIINYLSKQAQELSKQGIFVRAKVIKASLR